ncbi:MAG: hypothetical protein Q4C96_00265 [Planctomycetia bacterium]|nr:hypothetical protein [Planctomycetia bacterium]
MVTRRTFLRIQKKLAKKKNVLKIASETGTPLEIISAISDGWIPKFPKPGRPKKNLTAPSETPAFHLQYRKGKEYEQNSDTPPRRCPQCGHLVIMPCLACKLERMRLLQPSIISEKKRNTDLALNLKPEWKKRYEKIHQEKIMRRERELDLLMLNSERTPINSDFTLSSAFCDF